MNQEEKKEFKTPSVEHLQFEESNVIETSGNGFRGNTEPPKGRFDNGGPRNGRFY